MIVSQFAIDQGLAVADVLADTGLSADRFDDPDFGVTALQELTVLRNLRALQPEYTGLGLDLGRRYRLTSFGPLGYGCLTSPTLGDALTLGLTYIDLTFAFCVPDVAADEERFRVRIQDQYLPDDLRDLLIERDITALMSVVNDLLPGGIRPTVIHLPGPRPAHAGRLARAWRVEPEFDRSETYSELPIELLATPLPQADPAMHARCVAKCGILAAARRGDGAALADRIRERLSRFDRGVPTIDQVAQEWHMSSRTLRRRLTEAGTSFRELLSEARREAATRLLTEGVSVGGVAQRLGYAEAAPFIRAFKSWTGTTPTADRGPA
ncbi:AraC family transcriptional regulator [Tsukamurella sp. 8F]|uniref:AraC family transcriptional regulator n=1 Tax=Tsukamurella sp. 8F TaxID=3031961 RepID=UPI0023B9CBBF|nr:AraC family transcriptional regulator [Tsukamurella sp. 8F]MDF0587140.1 AraC family transcriptional regulator [Tsukamurella sp. 8F]